MKWVLKTSSVRVGTSDDDRVYRSIQDAPPELRDRIRKAIEGPNVRTILIANQTVYDQILSESESSNFEEEHGPEASPLASVASVARAESLDTRDRRLPSDARRVLIVIFASIAALWTIWALLIQIGR